MNPDTVLEQAKDVTYEVVAGEAILIEMKTGTYFSLNEVGTIFWEKLDGHKSIKQIASDISSIYNQKAIQLADELGQIALSENVKEYPAKAENVANKYELDSNVIMEYLNGMQSGDIESQKKVIIEGFSITQEMVATDLLELVESMAADKLVKTVI